MATQLRQTLFRNSGTTQDQRLLPALSPETAPIDHRSLEDLLAYAWRFSGHLNYYNHDNQIEGDWKSFLTTDLVFPYAVIASSTQPDVSAAIERLSDRISAIDGDAKSRNRLYREDFELVGRPIRQLSTALASMLEWPEMFRCDCEMNRSLEQVINGYILPIVESLRALDHPYYSRGKLATRALLEFFERRGVTAERGSGDTLTEDERALCGDSHFVGAGPKLFMSLNSARMIRDQLMIMDDSIAVILQTLKGQAQTTINKALQGDASHPPHTGLLLAFLKMFQDDQRHLNQFTRRHIDYYFKDILRMKARPEKSDQAYLVLGLQANCESYPIPAGTAFNAGKDAHKQDLVYRLKETTSINRTEIADIRSIKTSLVKGERRFYESPMARTKDGLGEDLDPDRPNWFAFGQVNTSRPALGFAIASPILRLAEGRRKIRLKFDLILNEQESVEIIADELEALSESIMVSVTGKKSWLRVAPSVAYRQRSAQLVAITLRFILDEDMPAVVDYLEDVHLEGLAVRTPVVRVELKRDDVDAVGIPARLYELLNSCVMETVDLKVDVQGLRTLVVDNGDALLDTSKSFTPWGGRPSLKSGLYVSSHEAFCKPLSSLSVDIAWEDLPADLKKQYQPYFDATREEDFTIEVSTLKKGEWVNPSIIPFGEDPEQSIPIETVFPKLPEDMQREEYAGYSNASRSGYLRIRPASPRFCFGHEIYPELQAIAAQAQAAQVVAENQAIMTDTLSTDYSDIYNQATASVRNKLGDDAAATSAREQMEPLPASAVVPKAVRKTGPASEPSRMVAKHDVKTAVQPKTSGKDKNAGQPDLRRKRLDLSEANSEVLFKNRRLETKDDVGTGFRFTGHNYLVYRHISQENYHWTADTPNSPFTIQLWLKIEALPKAWAAFLVLGRQTRGAIRWLVDKDGTGRIGPCYGGQAEQFCPKLELNRWTNLALTFDGANLNCYVDGKPYGETIVPKGINITANMLALGRRFLFKQRKTDNFVGRIAEVCMYPRALKQPQLARAVEALPQPAKVPAGNDDLRRRRLDLSEANSEVLFKNRRLETKDDVGTGFRFTGHNYLLYRHISRENYHWSADTPKSPFTIQLWLKIEAYPKAWAGFLVLGRQTRGAIRWLVDKDGTGRIGPCAGGPAEQFCPKLELNRWTNLALTFDGANLNCYVDGKPYGETIVPKGINITANMLSLGRRFKVRKQSENFVGRIAEVCMYPRALKPAQVERAVEAMPRQQTKAADQDESTPKRLDLSAANQLVTFKNRRLETKEEVGTGFRFTGHNYLVLREISQTNYRWSAETPRSPFTIQLWLKIEAYPKAWAAFLVLGRQHRGAIRWLVDKDGTGRIGPCYAGQAEQFCPKLELNRWTNLALSFDGTNLNCYLDGNPYGETIVPKGMNIDANMLSLGQHFLFKQRVSDNLVGRIAEVDMYPRALNPAEVKQAAQSRAAEAAKPLSEPRNGASDTPKKAGKKEAAAETISEQAGASLSQVEPAAEKSPDSLEVLVDAMKSSSELQMKVAMEVARRNMELAMDQMKAVTERMLPASSNLQKLRAEPEVGEGGAGDFAQTELDEMDLMGPEISDDADDVPGTNSELNYDDLFADNQPPGLIRAPKQVTVERPPEKEIETAEAEQEKAPAVIREATVGICEPYTPVCSSLKLNYSSRAQTSIDQPNDLIEFLHIHPYGVDTAPEGPVRLMPRYSSDGYLYLGLRHVKAPQKLSLLFQFDESTADPAATPDTILWTYLSHDCWKELVPESQDFDGTDNCLHSGIIQFDLPTDISSDNRLLPANLCWLRAELPNGGRGINKLFDIHAQAIKVEFENQGNDLAHLESAMPAGSIRKLVAANNKIKEISQPYASFGGLGRERDLDLYCRVSERLRHKDRAVNGWDYEHLVLEEFPELYKVKCVNHSDQSSEKRPGAVTLLVIAHRKETSQRNDLYPRVNPDVLDKVHDFLRERISPFVQLEVINPDYDELELEVGVVLRDGYDALFANSFIQRRLREFVGAWSYGVNPAVSGESLHKSILINFVEHLEPVDFLSHFRMNQITSDGERAEGVDEVIPSSSRTIIVTAAAHKIEIQAEGSIS